METVKGVSRAALSALVLALPCGALAADSSPTFAALARDTGTVAKLGTSPIGKPELARSPAPRVSEMRVVPGTDGELHVVCREVPNPKLQRAAAHDAENPTP